MVTFNADEQRVVLIALALVLALSGAHIFSRSSRAHGRAASHPHPAAQGDSSGRTARQEDRR